MNLRQKKKVKKRETRVIEKICKKFHLYENHKFIRWYIPPESSRIRGVPFPLGRKNK